MSIPNTPYGAFKFMVTIDGVAAASFMECGLPSVSFDVIDYRSGDEAVANVHKLPGLVRYGNLVLKRGLVSGASTLALWDWISKFVAGTGSPTRVSVVLLDSPRVPVITWSFSNCWPVKYELPVLSGDASDIAVETLEIAVEGITVTGSAQGS
ncbi:MAG: phage tail protein [Nitrososphaerota archaeon]|nr:phage tail protein [Nitrososphaerota archaeon]